MAELIRIETDDSETCSWCAAELFGPDDVLFGTDEGNLCGLCYGELTGVSFNF